MTGNFLLIGGLVLISGTWCVDTKLCRGKYLLTIRVSVWQGNMLVTFCEFEICLLVGEGLEGGFYFLV